MTRPVYWLVSMMVLFLLVLPGLGQIVSQENKKIVVKGKRNSKSNSNQLIKKHRAKLKYSCSSFWPTWGPQKAFDGDPLKSWFSQRGDAAALGKKPWVAVSFPRPVTVRRVTLMCNREPPWEKGFTILVGRLELLDKHGKVLYKREDEVGAERPDMEVRPRRPIEGVVKVRFTSLQDEGDQNSYEDIAIGEILIE